MTLANSIRSLPVLIGCEESQTTCRAFRKVGLSAYSCDIVETRGNPEWHYHQDVSEVIPSRQWGLIILHPDCSALCVSGNRWYAAGKPKHYKRLEAIKWTIALWTLAKEYSPRVALENPVSVIFKYLPNSHYLQPWQFGHGETKKTGFALYGLLPLQPTNYVDGRKQRVWKMPPSKTRKRDRSETLQGVATAMAEQWGKVE